MVSIILRGPLTEYHGPRAYRRQSLALIAYLIGGGLAHSATRQAIRRTPATDGIEGQKSLDCLNRLPDPE